MRSSRAAARGERDTPFGAPGEGALSRFRSTGRTRPASLIGWLASFAAAIQFWDEVHADTHIDGGLRTMVATNANCLRTLRERI